MKKKVISAENLPVRNPMNSTIIALIVLDHVNPPIWVRDIIWTLIALVWISTVYRWWYQETIDIFDTTTKV